MSDVEKIENNIVFCWVITVSVQGKGRQGELLGSAPPGDCCRSGWDADCEAMTGHYHTHDRGMGEKTPLMS